jgi:tetratricopeptide (TPR) repeat protein
MGGPEAEDSRTPPVPQRWGFLRRLFGAAPPPSEPWVLPGRVGHYRVVEQLGEGGMGRVLLAVDESLRRNVALKTLKRMDASSRRRFLHEARAAARVSHPNVCPIFEVGEDRGLPFLAMELLSGETLSSRLRKGPLAPAEALDVGQDLLAALGALHDAGLVHRDVKPSNLFLTAHGGKLLDFGLAREVTSDVACALGSTTDLTHPGLIVGTPGYMATEQILGRPVDARADIFGAGAVLYEALSGHPPFGGDSAVQALSRTLYDEPPPLAGSPVLEALDLPVRRALAKQPDGRFASAAEMAEALRAVGRVAEVGTASALSEGFVGRQAELAWLEERFAAAAAGSGSVVFVTGERGVGKSTLVGEFLRRIRAGLVPVTVVAGRCTETQGPGEAFLPFLDAVGRLLTSRGRDQASELLRTYAPTVCVQMPAGLLPDPDGALHRQAAGATKERLIREGGDFMEAACRVFPIVLYLEDLQWADPASVDLLHHTGCRLARQRTLVVATFRQADVDAANPPMKRCAVDLLARGAARELSLGALTHENVGDYLAARFPSHRFPAALAPALHARTEGLALFVRSLVDILVERGDIVRDDKGWALARPVADLDLEPTLGLRELVRHQLGGLPGAEREILEVASVAGREFQSPVLAHLVGREERQVEEDLRRMCRVRRLLMDCGEETLPDGTLATRYRFAHGLYESVLREDVVASRRVALHRQVASRLRHHWGREAPRLAVEIARHCEQGHDPEGAIEFRRHAGDNAARLFAYAEAEEHYDWAFQSLEGLPAEARTAAAISLHQRRGMVRLAQVRFDAAASDFEEVVRVAREAGAGDAERAALAALCDTLFVAHRVEEMAVRAQELLDAAGRAGGEGAFAQAQAHMGLVLVSQGRFGEAVPMLEGAIASARRHGPTAALQIALAYRGVVHYWQTEYAAAEALSVEAEALARERGDGFYVLGAGMFRGLARANLGRMSEALDDFADSIGLGRRNHDRFWLPRLASHLGWVHRELGALERARELDAEAVRIAGEPTAWGPEGEVLLNLCLDDVRDGHPERASALLAELEARADESSWLPWMSQLRVAAAVAEHWAVRGDHSRALGNADRLSALARRLGARDYACAAERFRAGVALERGEGLDRVAASLGAALADLKLHPAPLEAWKSARVHAIVRRRLGDEEGARTAFAEAEGAVRTIAAGVRDDGLREGFLSLPAVREVLTRGCLELTGTRGI